MTTEQSRAVDESAVSEITIRPDGRVYAFGITAAVIDLLRAVPTSDRHLGRRLDRIAETIQQVEEPRR